MLNLDLVLFFSPLRLEIQIEFTLSSFLKDRSTLKPGFLEQVFLWVTLMPREAVAVIPALPSWASRGCPLLWDYGPLSFQGQHERLGLFEAAVTGFWGLALLCSFPL